MKRVLFNSGRRVKESVSVLSSAYLELLFGDSVESFGY